jgi:group I intron endonuclease
LFGFVYITKNLVTNTYYVGQTTCLYKKKYIGSGTILIKAIRKYGRSNFTCSPIQNAISKSDLDSIERYYIHVFRDAGLKMYNISDGGRSNGPGHRHSDETKEKMRMAKLGKKQTPEHVANMKAAKTGIRPSPRSLAGLKIYTDSIRGRPNPKASKWMTGRIVSDSTRKKNSVAHKQPWNVAQLQKARSFISPNGRAVIAKKNADRFKRVIRDPLSGRIIGFSQPDEHQT